MHLQSYPIRLIGYSGLAVHFTLTDTRINRHSLESGESRILKGGIFLREGAGEWTDFEGSHYIGRAVHGRRRS